MSTKPHSREKKVVQKTVRVEKRKIENKNNTNSNKILKGIFNSLIKK